MPWLEVLGWSGSALLIFSLLQTRVLRFRALNLVACCVLGFFNAAIGVWSMAAQNVVLAGINVFFLARLLRERHDEAAFEVLEVDPYDEYLRHVLRVHGDDILRYQPDFLWDPDQDTDHAFLVTKGDETVGVVIVTCEGDTARIRLDYVTPRYRDFSPGEFVWRRSGIFTDLGVRRVTTPPNMVNAYYDRVGFRSSGDSYVLDLT
ncbi:hypothetical protein [Nocardioides caricicola]|uniref:N-acetyltransferase domain-containing protein n=1 Tax=Nocardioides caricicola TaxID=634770 RepID=A0ABW0N1W5_9ACTN